MTPSSLRRIFLGILAAPSSIALVACSSSSSTDPLARWAGTPPGHTDVTLAAIDRAAAEDGGSADDAGDAGARAPHAAGEQLDGQVCRALCPPSGITSGFCSIESVHGDTATLACHVECTGRRPEGLAEGRLTGQLAEMARLEAASVFAFKRLRDELAAHGAPRRLLRACGRAARDEVRHARTMGALARRRGQRIEAPRVEPARPRSLAAMATENAVEGCVRETYGALVATRDADAHPDPLVRAAMKRIAKDETRHAALSWEIAAWIEPRLDAAARARLRAARRSAAFELDASANDPATRALLATLWA